jgi:hypothetical protein
MKTILLLSFTLTHLLPLYVSCAIGDFLPFRVSVAVVDEAGRLLEGAEISLEAFLPESQRQNGRSYSEQIKLSNARSPVEFRGRCLHTIIVRVNKEGCYTSWKRYRLNVNYLENRYDPWDQTFRIVLKRQVELRPLYVHRVNWRAVPAFDIAIGFDLEKADWVRPYGDGVHSDFIIKLTRSIGQGEVYEGRMDLTFSNPMDGIFPVDASGESDSLLLIGREAPIEGYRGLYSRVVGVDQREGTLVRIDDPTSAQLFAHEGMWFRVRSELDEGTGELRRARYGKIDGFVDFEVREPEIGGQVRFVYYLSPDDSRSLEWNGESLVEHPDLQGITKF